MGKMQPTMDDYVIQITCFHEILIYFRTFRYLSPHTSEQFSLPPFHMIGNRFDLKYLPGTEWSSHQDLLLALEQRHLKDLSHAYSNDILMTLVSNQCLVCPIVLSFLGEKRKKGRFFLRLSIIFRAKFRLYNNIYVYNNTMVSVIAIIDFIPIFRLRSKFKKVNLISFYIDLYFYISILNENYL